MPLPVIAAVATGRVLSSGRDDANIGTKPLNEPRDGTLAGYKAGSAAPLLDDELSSSSFAGLAGEDRTPPAQELLAPPPLPPLPDSSGGMSLLLLRPLP